LDLRPFDRVAEWLQRDQLGSLGAQAIISGAGQ